MNRIEIRKQVIEYVEEQVEKLVNKEKESYNLVHFCTMSHNIFHFMPSVPGNEHWNIYKKILRDRILSTNNDYFLTFDYQNMMRNFCREKLEPYLPAIIASFHFGERTGYFFPIIRENINLALLSGYSGEGLIKKKEQVDKEVAFTKRFFPQSTAELYLLSYTSKTLFFDMIKKIKDGYSVMWFPDWADKYVKIEECVEVSFLGKKIFIPKGLAIFSFMSKRPIIPLFSFYDNEMQPECAIGDIIQPDNLDIKEYIVTVTQKLYSELEKNLKQHYCHWEGWFNIHRFTTGDDMISDYTIPELDKKKTHKCNNNASFFSVGQNYFVMNRETGKIIELDHGMFDKIQQSQFNDMQYDDLRILYRNGILV